MFVNMGIAKTEHVVGRNRRMSVVQECVVVGSRNGIISRHPRVGGAMSIDVQNQNHRHFRGVGLR